MANNIKGITIEIGGDTTPLDKALKSMNTTSKALQTELQKVDKLLKLDPKNTELLTQKQKVLSEAIAETNKKLDELKKAKEKADAVIASGGEVSEKQYRELQREIIATENNLKNLEKAADDTGKEIEESGEKSEDAGKRFEKFADIAKNVAAKITAAFAAVVTAAGAIAIKLGKEVIKSFADYEQLVGGVDTLFKESSDKLQEYASNAYKTAGLNANEYMETVTSFSASLISSLGGDTEKAVEYANMAITDMSDNVNKMGSDMSSIQAAYQGFAKQNYTMLDNLKLGYGGTKTEMQRLLADAEAISGIKYDVSSYADIVSAIHVIQQEMGIAGTTAQEAEHTITGSINAFESALGNFTVGLGNADADMAQLTQNLADTFQSVIYNITPIIENIVAALPTAFDAILSALSDMSPQILSVASDLISQILNMLVSLLPELISAAIDVVLPIITTLFQDMPLLAGTVLVAALAPALAMFGKMAQGISSIITVVTKLTPTIKGLSAVMLANPAALVVAGIVALIAVFVLLYNKCEWFRDGVNAIWEAIKTAFFTAFDAVKVFFTETLPGVFGGIVDFIANNWQALLLLLVNPFAGAFKLLYDNCEGFRSAIDNLIENIKVFFQGLWDKIVEIFSGVGRWFNDRFTEAYNNVTKVFQAIGQWFAARWQDIQNALAQVANWFNTMFQNAYNNVTKVFQAIGQWFAARWQDIQNALAQVANWFNTMFQNAYNNVTKVFQAIGQWFAARWQDIQNALAQVANWFLTMFQNAYKNIQQTFEAIGNWFKARYEDITNVFKAIPDFFKGVFQNAVDTIKNVFGGIVDWFTGIVNKIKGLFSGIADSIRSAVDDANDAASSAKKSGSTPKFAKGGVLSNGRGIVAEAGPELIEMVNGRAVITPLTNSATNTPLDALGGGGVAWNQINNFYSPKALTPYETARLNRNATQQTVLKLYGKGA